VLPFNSILSYNAVLTASGAGSRRAAGGTIVTRLHETPAFRLIVVSTLALTLTIALVAITSRPAHGDPQAPQTFHLAEIYKIMAGYNGNTAIQAVEIRMNATGENLVNGASIVVYNADGTTSTNLGTFAADVPNGVAGGRILCATTGFQTTFGITADLTFSPGIIPMTGQVSYEKPTCLVNAIPYGNVTAPLTSTTMAPFLPVQGATVLLRTIDTPGVPSCPLAENAGLRFQQKQGTPASPITFTNNAGVSVPVSSTVTGVGGTPPAPQVLRVFPNPVRGTTRIEAPGWQPLTIHDIRGRLVRVLTCIPGGACPDVAGRYLGEWDGTDSRGRAVPSGIYFLKYTAKSGTVVKRIAVTR